MSYSSKSFLKKPKRTNRDLSHTHVTTVDSGKLVPIFCEPVVPGDTFRMRAEIYMRFQALLAPVMDRMNVYCHWFFVPYRIIFKQWREFITKGSTGEVDIVYPRLRLRTEDFFGNKPVTPAQIGDFNKIFGPGSVYNYLGFPDLGMSYPDVSAGHGFSRKQIDIDLLPFLAYYRIWCDYYRDENLSTIYNEAGRAVDEFEPIEQGIKYLTGDVESGHTLVDEVLKMRYRAWEKDYFTSALPWAQRGADVIIPGTQGADPSNLAIGVKPTGNDVSIGSVNGYVTLDAPHLNTEQGFPVGYPSVPLEGISTGGNVNMALNGGTSNANMVNSIEGQLHGSDAMNITADQLQAIANELEVIKADVSRVSDGVADVGTINNLRRANALQKYLEAMARGGSRYIEQIKAIFGVTSSDARLQRAEYLGGFKQNVVISEVLQQSGDSTSPTGEEQVLGSYAGRAVSGGTGKTIKRFFEEHGQLMCIMSLKPRSSYMPQGLPRKYSKFDPYDYLNPYFANLGEQEIKNQELFFISDAGAQQTNEETFGYAPRYAEYTYCPSRVSGEMSGSLAYWNLSRKFSTLPVLSQNFVEVKPEDTDRVFALNHTSPIYDDNGNIIAEYETDRVQTQINFKITAKRPLPKDATPRL